MLFFGILIIASLTLYHVWRIVKTVSDYISTGAGNMELVDAVERLRWVRSLVIINLVLILIAGIVG